MRSCTYYSVLERAVSLAGFTVSGLTATPRAQFNTKITARLKDAWECAWWPELMRSELRYYRDTWLAQTYLAGSELWHAGTSKYWTNLTLNAASTDVPGVSSKWTVLTDLDPYISLDQANETAIGEIRGIYLDDPLTTDKPRRTPFVLGSNGAQVLGENVPTAVYVWYRIRLPEFFGADYSATTAYAINRTLYYTSTTPGYEGDYWTTVSATTAGQSPETTAAKWTQIEFPLWLRAAVAHGAYADWLRLDGEGDLALAEDNVAEGKLSSEVCKLAGQGQIQYSRAS